MTTLAPRATEHQSCSLCPDAPQATPRYDDFCWATSCTRYSMPIITLKRHTDSPTAGEWNHMERLAKRQFPEYRFWHRPPFGTTHYFLHAVDLAARCNRDHAIVA